MLPNSGGTSLAVDIFNITSGDWSRKDFFYPHLYAAHATWGNKIFVAGGGKKFWSQSNQQYVFTDRVEIRDVTLGLSDIAGAVSFDVYPNPSSGPMTLLLPDAHAEIYVTDIFGHEVQHVKATSRMMELQLNESGIYLVHIHTRKGVAVRKVIIDR